jgi:hypothetical protein
MATQKDMINFLDEVIININAMTPDEAGKISFDFRDMWTGWCKAKGIDKRVVLKKAASKKKKEKYISI